jgi:hypothetical protein
MDVGYMFAARSFWRAAATLSEFMMSVTLFHLAFKALYSYIGIINTGSLGLT